MFLQQCATVHRTVTAEHSTGLLFLPTTIACCLYITRLGLAEKLWRLAMFIKFRSIRICKITPDLPSPTNTAVRSQQRLNTPEAQKVSNFYFVNDNLLFDLYFQGGPWPLWYPWLRQCIGIGLMSKFGPLKAEVTRNVLLHCSQKSCFFMVR